MATTQLVELVQSNGDLRVNKASGVIRNVRILHKESRNNRTYSPNALQQVARLAEGTKVFADHPGDPGRVRDIGDWLGTISNTRVDADSVLGDLLLLLGHPLVPMILEGAMKFPNSFGISINAEGDLHPGPDGRGIVEGVHRLRSCDLVTEPAAGKGLFESVRPRRASVEPGRPLSRITPEVIESLRGKISGPVLDQLREVVAADKATGRTAAKTWLQRITGQPSDSERVASEHCLERITSPPAPGERATAPLTESQRSERPDPWRERERRECCTAADFLKLVTSY